MCFGLFLMLEILNTSANYVILYCFDENSVFPEGLVITDNSAFQK